MQFVCTCKSLKSGRTEQKSYYLSLAPQGFLGANQRQVIIMQFVCTCKSLGELNKESYYYLSLAPTSGLGVNQRQVIMQFVCTCKSSKVGEPNKEVLLLLVFGSLQGLGKPKASNNYAIYHTQIRNQKSRKTIHLLKKCVNNCVRNTYIYFA